MNSVQEQLYRIVWTSLVLIYLCISSIISVPESLHWGIIAILVLIIVYLWIDCYHESITKIIKDMNIPRLKSDNPYISKFKMITMDEINYPCLKCKNYNECPPNIRTVAQDVRRCSDWEEECQKK